MLNINIVIHSIHGHVYALANAIAEGANSIDGMEAKILRVPETLPDDTLAKMKGGAKLIGFDHIPVATVEDLEKSDGLIFGTPTRFGNMSAQMRSFLDQTGGLWMKGALIDKIGSVFVSTSTQHGGQETTITSFHTTLLHHGMIIAGVPFSVPELGGAEEVTGGGPYGAGSISGQNGKQPTERELKFATAQGERVARQTKRLRG